MSDDTTTPDPQDTSSESAPAEGHAHSDEPQVINYEQRYNDLRPKFDQTAQEAAQYRDIVEGLTNPETQAEYLRLLEVELPEVEDDGDEDWLDPAVEERIAALEQQIAQRDQQAEQAAEQEAIRDHLADQVVELEEQVGELTQDEVELLVARAEYLPDHNGLPDVKAAWQQLSGLYDSRVKTWAETKRAPRVPDGQSASKQYDLSTEEGRREAFQAGLSAID